MPGTPPKRRSGFPGWRFVVCALLLAILISGFVRALVFDVYYIPSGSMAPLFDEGDRVLVSRLDQDIHRGDVVVFDGRGSFAPISSGRSDVVDGVVALGRWIGLTSSDTVYVKRVIGVGGDTVACCSPTGQVMVNGEPIDEPYLFSGDKPSSVEFEAEVPQGRLWVMGDHRSVSADSRSLLGAPGGGMVPEDRVIGQPVAIIWPFSSAGKLESIHLTAPVQSQNQ
ncbi:signal peptidase I [Arthrobacter roseus]|uniref:signal peptidase I n=1 Tax=Arthrobacter roseus TaxID=136274 RepID=UPI001EF955E5|nr:signal peptidase I [Arthrobacter roseus]